MSDDRGIWGGAVLIVTAGVLVLAGIVALVIGQHRSPLVRKWSNRVFALFFTVFAGSAVAFLLAALVPFFDRSGFDRFPFPSGLQVGLEYTFSALNIALAVLLMRLRPRDRAARLLALGMVGTGAVFNFQSHAAFLATPAFAEAVHEWFHVVGGITYLFAVVVFPDGHFKPRWRELPWWGWPLRIAYLVLLPVAGFFVVFLFHGGDPEGYLMIFGGLIPVAGLGAQMIRLRYASSSAERVQSRLLVATMIAALGGAATFGVLALLLGPGAAGGPRVDELRLVVFQVFPALFAAIPVLLFAILVRFQLWNIDRVLKRTFVYGALTGFITCVYVAVVVGAGTRLGGGSTNLALSIVVTALVAVLFQPLRRRLQRIANGLVYGRRTTPYEALAGFSRRVADLSALDDVLPRLARILAEATSASLAQVWVAAGDSLVRAAVWPRGPAPGPDRLARTDGGLPAFDEASRAVPVVQGDALLGALAITKPAGEVPTSTEERVLDDLAAQAGLLLRNAGLSEELRARVRELSMRSEELRASRQRIVAAHDDHRRRLERDLHDGAQQHLVALAVRLGLLGRLAARGPQAVGEALVDVRRQADETLASLRDLANGVYPASLSDRGLAPALRDVARRAPLRVGVEDHTAGRHPPEVEAAVYFCCLEALQNAVKYAQASRADVRLEQRDGALAFSVSDDGRGFDVSTTPRGSGLQNIADRLAALDGTLEIRSRRGGGTTVAGTVTVRVTEGSR